MNPASPTTNDFAGYAQKVSARTAFIGAALSIGALLISRPVAMGMLFGVVAGVVKLKITSRSLLRFASMGAEGKQRYMVRQNVLKYAYAGAVLFVAFSTDYLNEWATLAGLLLPNLVTIASGVLSASADAGRGT